MSIILYEADNLTIIAGKGEYAELESAEKRKTIRLHISVLINGKIKNIFQEYRIKDGILNEHYSAGTLSDVLSSLGYPITGIYPMIEKGIEKLFND